MPERRPLVSASWCEAMLQHRGLAWAASGAAAAALAMAAADESGPALGASAAAIAGGAAFAVRRVLAERSRQRHRDPVTGLFDGEYLTHCWGRLARRARNQHPLAVLMATIDDGGTSPNLEDDERRLIADSVLRACGEHDLAFITGPARFVVLAPDAVDRRIGALAERLRACIRAALRPDLAVRARVRICVSIVGRPPAVGAVPVHA